MIDRDMVSKAEVLDIYAELYDEFDDAPGIIKVLHKVCDKLKRLQPQEPVVSPTIGGWISVKERLPEKNGRYLCRYEQEIHGEICRCTDFGMYDSNIGKNGGWFVGKVTHWMPLPEAPKEGE